MAVVQFDAADFLELYPQFVGKVTEKQMQYAFKQACLFVDNTENSPFPYDPENGVEKRKILLDLLTCHLLSLSLWEINQAGPLTNATEGSVSVGYQAPTGSDEWYKLSKCGRDYWMLMHKFGLGGKYYPKPNYHPWG